MGRLHLVLFTSDLRIHDHGPLRAACIAAEKDGGSVLPLYVVSPSEKTVPVHFLIESLQDLAAALEARGAKLHLRVGAPEAVIKEIHRSHGLAGLYWHCHAQAEDSSTDRALRAWCLRAGIAERSFHADGYVPGLETGHSWQFRWESQMSARRITAPDHIAGCDIGVGKLPVFESEEHSKAHSKGGRSTAIELLKTILDTASNNQVQTPPKRAGRQAYHALAPFLALGALSVREVWQSMSAARDKAARSDQDVLAAVCREFLNSLMRSYQPELSYGARSSAKRAARFRQSGQRQSDHQLSLGL